MKLNTKFADMSQHDISAWTQWANRHDWGGPFAGYDADTHEMVTYTQEHDGTKWAIVEARHKTPQAMRDWAGY